MIRRKLKFRTLRESKVDIEVSFSYNCKNLFHKEEYWAYLPNEIDEFNSAMIINKCYENCWEEDGKFDRKGIPL